MLKTGSKRRRTKMEIIQDKEQEIAKENEYRTKMARLEQVESELLAVTQQAEVNKQAAVLVSDLINKGIVQQQADNTFVALSQEGPQRFDYDEQQENV